ncbi:MAG: lipoate--protein ligase [Butyrivibrio sp.]|nr:lipoate--protein ligase [Acetatifactor muris]MCM1559367.1 lipoate--protein ligase [Butyrivibrio sp.]
MKCLIYDSKNYLASRNLAVEEFLFGLADRSGCAILYLWQNDKAVILGRNQNACDEVNLDVAQQFGIQVARRMTGGGAVFHDLGNLNYTMIFPTACVKKDSMYTMLAGVFGKLGVTVSVGGRNDIYMGGFKISGNAFYTNGRCYLHHGTVLVDSDLDMMNAVLCTPSGKMARRSVKSVLARVRNIKDVLPDITVREIKLAITEEYEKWADAVFGICPEEIQVDGADIEGFLQKYNNPLWNFGNGKRYECEMEKRYGWGDARIVYNQRNGIVTDVKIYTDSLEVDEVENAERNFIGKHI